MLFERDIFVSNIIRDSAYVVGKNVDYSISFGGDKNNSDYENFYNRIRDLGIIPLFSDYLETVINDDNLDIIYSDTKNSGDLAREFITFRKVSIPSYINNCSDLGEYLYNDISDFLKNKYALDSVDLIINAGKVGRPRSREVINSISHLKSQDEKYKSLRTPDSSVYCSVNGVECILSIYEGSVRDLELLPVRYDFNYLVEFWRLVSSYSDEFIVEFVSAL